jgi:RimJ/RimL family protein N-acetyltransferase
MTPPILVDLPEQIDVGALRIRRPRPGDGPALCEAVTASMPALRPWMPWAQAETDVEQSEAAVLRMHADFGLRNDLSMLVFERRPDGGEGRVVGGTGLHRIDWAVRRFEIGHWRRSGCDGAGVAATAAGAMVRLAFDRLAARRVEIRMDARHWRSMRVAERLGFTLEGVLRQDSLAPDGRVRDTRVYARVRGVEEA